MRLSTFVSLLPLVAGAPATRKRAEPAPILEHRGEPKELVADKYIVKFRQGSAMKEVKRTVKLLREDPSQVFSDGIFTGFAGQIHSDGLEAIRQHPDVEYIEPVSVMSTNNVVSQTRRVPWGLERISHRDNEADSYDYDQTAGAGTCAYVIDSGVDINHPEFEGRATSLGSYIGNSDRDDCGHGTHVAGTIGSRSFGVAKKTHIFALKALGWSRQVGNCVGNNDITIAALHYVARHAAENRSRCPKGAVVNMSLGGPASRSVNEAVDNLAARGVFVAVASGNSNQDAENFSPASANGACCVGATDYYDRRYAMSNFGAYVDVAAPGVDVYSTLPNGQAGPMTGTSMASPHIAGLAAYLAARDGVSGPKLCTKIRNMATRGAIVNQYDDTRNLIAFNGGR
ncbi:oryzin precursor [Cordyceps fumosorosea ARSEF 2679]|uniref:Oryzin n=1 Tax=Cordyceps fumosorosea (strain ARSEF 2679) TaxID=1081104 RepID=A0A167VW35_CORFA|nr:oryzin precursor [Cordyceps fumosorosea ARSEF 2679]OAA63041.1 oryzin precursor [Cordyceps fumosorosea ARSEF 2679]